MWRLQKCLTNVSACPITEVTRYPKSYVPKELPGCVKSAVMRCASSLTYERIRTTPGYDLRSFGLHPQVASRPDGARSRQQMDRTRTGSSPTESSPTESSRMVFRLLPLWIAVLALGTGLAAGSAAAQSAGPAASGVKPIDSRTAASGGRANGSLAVGDPAADGPLPTTYRQQMQRRRQLQRVRPAANGRDAVTLTGLVLDETLTRYGRAFYTAFHQAWDPPAAGGIYAIQIREKPVPGRGTQVRVYINDVVIYQARLVPGPRAVGEHPERAVRRAFRYVRSGRANWEIF